MLRAKFEKQKTSCKHCEDIISKSEMNSSLSPLLCAVLCSPSGIICLTAGYLNLFLSLSRTDHFLLQTRRMGCRVTESIPPSASTVLSTATTTVDSKGPSCPPSSLAHLSSRPEGPSSTGFGDSSMTFVPIQPSISRLQQDAAVEYQRPQTARMDSPSDAMSSATPQFVHQHAWTPSFASTPTSGDLYRSSTLPTAIPGSQGSSNFATGSTYPNISPSGCHILSKVYPANLRTQSEPYRLT